MYLYIHDFPTAHLRSFGCWENMYIQIHYIRGVLISEQQVSKLNPLYTVANLTRLMPGITLVANEGHGEDGQHHIQHHRIQ